MIPGFQTKKAAQVAAYFALKAGGAINVLKLSKLLYLAERESMRLYDEPMFYDKLVSMDHGPVASVSLNLINGDTEAEPWGAFVGDRRGYDVPVKADVSFADLDELSRADEQILDVLWARFGGLNQYQLRDWTHANCPEWNYPGGTSAPIEHKDVFEALHKPEAEELAHHVKRYRDLERRMAETGAL